VTNTLAYYQEELITIVKKFYGTNTHEKCQRPSVFEAIFQLENVMITPVRETSLFKSPTTLSPILNQFLVYHLNTNLHHPTIIIHEGILIRGTWLHNLFYDS
jgi:hypothetical protein